MRHLGGYPDFVVIALSLDLISCVRRLIAFAILHRTKSKSGIAQPLTVRLKRTVRDKFASTCLL